MCGVRVIAIIIIVVNLYCAVVGIGRLPSGFPTCFSVRHDYFFVVSLLFSVVWCSVCGTVSPTSNDAPAPPDSSRQSLT